MKIYEVEKVGLGLTIFDIDDTLFHTTAQISVMKDGKVVRTLSNQEYNVYTLQPGESFDYGEFRNAEKFNKESVPIVPMIAKLKAILKNAGDSTVIMLTARNDFDNKELFLDTFKRYGIDMSKIHVHRSGSLGLPSAEGKAVWIRKYLDTGKYGRVRLYDDAMSNLKMLIGLREEYPNVQFFPYLVTPEGSIKTVKEDSKDALNFATQAHAGQERAGGGPYISHPIRVAQHVEQWKKSHNLDALISAAYLHDTLEDTDTTHEALHDLFGGLVASLVKELTSDKTQVQQMGKKNYLAQKMAAMSSYALVIKLADRLDNVRDITTARTPQWRAKYAAETNHILDYIEKNRVLTGTHQKLIGLIRDKLQEVTNPPEVAESNLNEVFDQPYPWTWTTSGKNRGLWIAEFNDVEVVINLLNAGLWEMSFDRNGSQAVTGEGDQFKIFSTVIDIAKDFVRQMQPERFNFSAYKDPDETTSSRPKLYSALIKKFASGLGYDSKEKTSDDFVFYMLTRKQPVAESQLEEAFDQPYPWKWGDRSSQRMWTASFADVVVIFSVDGAGEWEITFSRNNRQSVTGEGDQFKIFATVIDIAKDFISLMRPKVIQFTAHKEKTETTSSRTKLYSAMVNRFANSLGYESKEKPFNDFVVYVLTKKQDESVAEAFDTNIKWKLGHKSPTQLVYAALLDKNAYLELIYQSHDDWNTVQTAFTRNGSHEVTGGGGQMRIFGAVINHILSFIQKHNVNQLKFTAHKPEGGFNARDTGRSDLYKKMVMKYAQGSGYTLNTQDKGSNDVFTLTKSNPQGVTEDGKIVPGVNTTVDVKPGETERQAAKFGNKLTKSGPPLLMAEKRYTAKEWAILEGGHALEEKIVDHAPRKWFSV